MKVKEFAVSVQWGNGHHHFLKTDYESEDAAYHAGDEHAKRLARQRKSNKRGAKPTVYVWLRRYSIGVDP